jgi:response regulator RpfG family c-di-GMP phosphodiesterase
VSTESAPKILVVDDEEAILETMTFTFQDEYEVFTSTDARKGLDILDAEAPVAVVLSDQRMPEMSGVEFVTEVWKRHPTTTRMILTGFSDMEATLSAINDGHVYAYITKPWEPDQLKLVMKQAVDHHRLALENQRLLADVTKANSFLGAVMDQLDTGAIAVDEAGIIQACPRTCVANRWRSTSKPGGCMPSRGPRSRPRERGTSTTSRWRSASSAFGSPAAA